MAASCSSTTRRRRRSSSARQAGRRLSPRRVAAQASAKERAWSAARPSPTSRCRCRTSRVRAPTRAGCAEMLQEEAEDLAQDAFIPDLKKINSAGKHLLELINAVLDLSKIEAGKMDLFLEPFDVATLVTDIAAVVQPLADRNGNRLDVRCDPGAGEMRADLTKVRQALFNLLSTACQFT